MKFFSAKLNIVALNISVFWLPNAMKAVDFIIGVEVTKLFSTIKYLDYLTDILHVVYN